MTFASRAIVVGFLGAAAGLLGAQLMIGKLYWTSTVLAFVTVVVALFVAIFSPRGH